MGSYRWGPCSARRDCWDGAERALCMLQVAELGEPALAAKGLYGVSNLADSDRQRGAFYGAGGLGRMQGLLANASISNRVHRKVASLFGDLALRGEVSTQSALLHLIGLQPAEHVSHMKGWSRLSRTCLGKLLPSSNRGPQQNFWRYWVYGCLKSPCNGWKPSAIWTNADAAGESA